MNQSEVPAIAGLPEAPPQLVHEAPGAKRGDPLANANRNERRAGSRQRRSPAVLHSCARTSRAALDSSLFGSDVIATPPNGPGAQMPATNATIHRGLLVPSPAHLRRVARAAPPLPARVALADTGVSASLPFAAYLATLSTGSAAHVVRGVSRCLDRYWWRRIVILRALLGP